MPRAFILLKCVGKAVLKNGLNALAGGVPVGDWLFDVAEGVMEEWNRQRQEQELRAEVQALAVATAQEVREQAAEVVAELAANQPVEIRRALGEYLQQVPVAIRQSLRRPSDRSGTTVPPGLHIRKAEDLLPFLPTRLPRFKPGDRPLPGVDRELVELLGVGGFGEVWKAHNPHFDGVAPVALKFCLDPDAKKRLLGHEAAVLNQVMRHGQHDGIVALRQTYLSADPPCLEYDYIEGGDLAGLIQEWHLTKGGIESRKAVKIVLQLAKIVAYAHQLTPPIVHRDLKPANILVQIRQGALKLRVADFGIGGVVARQTILQTQRGVTRGQFLTNAVQGAYSPLYASPQQMRGEPPDPRDDVHALGVIWYQLLTGDLGAGVPGGIQWQKDLQKRGVTDTELQVLASCFEANVEHRPQDASVLVEELRGLVKVDTSPTVTDNAIPAPIPVGAAPAVPEAEPLPISSGTSLVGVAAPPPHSSDVTRLRHTVLLTRLESLRWLHVHARPGFWACILTILVAAVLVRSEGV